MFKALYSKIGKSALVLAGSCCLSTGCSDDFTAQPAAPPDSQRPDTNQVQDPYRFRSQTTGIVYPISYSYPDDYNEAREEPYPVMYVLDGQYHFENFSGIVRAQGLPVVVIGIHEGPANRRSVDYLLPGAGNYFQFLTQEFIPFIEEYNHVSSEGRTLVGTSASGVFVNTALLLDDPDDPVFANLLSNDAPFVTLHHAATLELEEARYAMSTNMPVHFILTGAAFEGDIGPFDEEVEAYYQLLLSRDYTGLELSRYTFQVNHFNIGTPALMAALRIFYDGENE